MVLENIVLKIWFSKYEFSFRAEYLKNVESSSMKLIKQIIHILIYLNYNYFTHSILGILSVVQFY